MSDSRSTGRNDERQPLNARKTIPADRRPNAFQACCPTKGAIIKGEGSRIFAIVSWLILVIRFAMLGMTILCIAWIYSNWSCTSDQISNVNNAVLLAARTRIEEVWQVRVNKTSESLTRNFSDLSDFSVMKIHNLTERVSSMENLTQSIRAQEEDVIAISVANNSITSTLSRLESMLSTQVIPIGQVVVESATAMTEEIDRRGRSHQSLIMNVSSICSKSSKTMLSLEESTSQALLTLQEWTRNVPKNVSQILAIVLDSEKSLENVAKEASLGLQEANTLVFQTHQVLNMTTDSITKVLANVTATLSAYQVAAMAVPGLILELQKAATESSAVVTETFSYLACKLSSSTHS